jgi:hypothetical protein
MADFIQGQPPQQQAQQPQQGSAGDFLSSNEKSQLSTEAATNMQQPPPPPQGIPQGAGLGATMENPLEGPEEEASPEEQKQYNDLFHRAMAMINDTRKQGDNPSVAQTLIKLMSTKGKEAHVAIGTTAGMVLMRLIDTAKRANVSYVGPVLQEVALDIVVELTDIAQGSGAIKNIPPEDSEPYKQLIKLASLEMAKMVGEWMLQTGQADQQGHMKEIQQQMQREADGGELDDWNMQELDPQIRQQVGQAAMAGGRQVQPQQPQQAPQAQPGGM